jgi:hypothetical protein
MAGSKQQGPFRKKNLNGHVLSSPILASSAPVNAGPAGNLKITGRAAATPGNLAGLYQ